MNFGENILKYKDELLADLKTLIEIKSVASETPDECVKALDFILRRALDFGLETKNIENKAGHAQIGSGGKLCGALTHLDVVPAGKNWTYEPFTLTRENGRLYGRGVDDDKGASIVDLYCLRALRESGVQGRNTLRAIFGTDEEVGMSDMETYFKYEPVPDMSFTPDSEYGICLAEKGILQLKISGGESPNGFDSISAGKALNAVPDEAIIIIDGKETVIKGSSAHACECFKGDNAAVKLALEYDFDSDILGFIKKYLTGTDGEALGIKMSDEPSGSLTVCLGSLRINKDESYFTLDIRYPVTKEFGEVFDKIKILCENYNFTLDIVHHSTPLYLPEDSDIVRALSSAYEKITGEKPELYSTGGGTYARVLGGKGVAFGPAFKDDNVNMHNADESIDEDKFFKHAQICLQAMYELYTME